MNRLLMAAARGARVQYRFDAWGEGVWNTGPIYSTTFDTKKFGTHTRIHPEDAHLEYGPVSTALREIAANPSYELAHTDELGTWSLLYSDWCACRDLASERDVSLFLLILAEALCDEGL